MPLSRPLDWRPRFWRRLGAGADESEGRWAWAIGDEMLVTATGSTTARLLRDRFADVVNVKDFLPAGQPDGTTDNTSGIAAWVTAAAGKIALLRPGTYISSPVALPSNTRFIGAGTRATTLKLKTGSNADFLTNLSANPQGTVLSGLTIDGNASGQTPATSGAIVWNCGSGQDGPALVLDDVVVTNAAGDAATNAAVSISGSTWMSSNRLRLFQNRKCRGLMLKTSDSILVGLYAASNGGDNGFQGVVVQGGAANMFIAPYFGGGDGAESVLLWGASYTQFIGGVNDSAWTHGYRLIDFGGTPSSFNQWNGGVITNPSQALTNTYDHIRVEGLGANNRFSQLLIHNTAAWAGKYGFNHTGTGTANYDRDTAFGTMGTAQYGTWTTAGLAAGNDAGVVQAGRIYQGSGVPNNANGNNGDAYFRTDTPGTANQRLYMKSAGAWVGIL